MRGINYFNTIRKKFLFNYTDEDLYKFKKAEVILKIDILLIFLGILAAIMHYSLFLSKPLLLIGDIFLIFGMIVSLLFLRRGNIVSGGTISIVVLIVTPFLQNVIGDAVSPAGVTSERYFETLIFICMILPVVTNFALVNYQLFLASILSAAVLIIHFLVLKLILKVNIRYDYLLYLTATVIPGTISVINLKMVNEAIESLVQSKKQIEEWNKSLEQVVKVRTKELMEANQKLKNMSMTDGLTGISNRRRFDMHYKSEWNRARRSETSLAIFMLDIDNFKMYNDYFGHQQGDRCLQLVAKKLESYAQRSGELAARYGGEEFVIIAPRMLKEEALMYAELIRSAVEALGLPQSPSAHHNVVTVSIGIVSHPILQEDTPEAYLKEADNALYKAKEKGRNRIELA